MTKDYSGKAIMFTVQHMDNLENPVKFSTSYRVKVEIPEQSKHLSLMQNDRAQQVNLLIRFILID